VSLKTIALSNLHLVREVSTYTLVLNVGQMFSTTIWTRNNWNSITGYVDSFGLLPGSGIETFEEEIFRLGLKKYDVDPCVFLREGEKGFCVLCIYVDDTIIAGEEGMMEDTTMRHGLVFISKSRKALKTSWDAKFMKELANIS
jgi:hypothetical protein